MEGIHLHPNVLILPANDQSYLALANEHPDYGLPCRLYQITCVNCWKLKCSTSNARLIYDYGDIKFYDNDKKEYLPLKQRSGKTISWNESYLKFLQKEFAGNSKSENITI